MSDIKTIEGNFVGGKGNYALVVGRWNSFVVEHLLAGAIDTLRRHGVSDKQMTIVRAPGAFEIPLVAQMLAEYVIQHQYLSQHQQYKMALSKTLCRDRDTFCIT